MLFFVAIRHKNQYTAANFIQDWRGSVTVQKTITSSPRQLVARVIFIQAGLAIAASFLMFIFLGARVAQAVFLAGVIVVLANGVFASLLFRYRGVGRTTRIAVYFLLGELLKLILSAVLMAVAVVALGVEALPLLITYMALQILLLPTGIVAWKV